MARGGGQDSGKEKVTVKGRLVIEDRYALAKLPYTMRLFRDAVEMAYRLMKREGLSRKEVVRRVAKFISNRHYADSAVRRAEMYLVRERLDLRKPQLYSIRKGV